MTERSGLNYNKDKLGELKRDFHKVVLEQQPATTDPTLDMKELWKKSQAPRQRPSDVMLPGTCAPPSFYVYERNSARQPYPNFLANSLVTDTKCFRDVGL